MSDNVVFLDQFRRAERTATRTFAEFQNDCFQACVVMHALEHRNPTLAKAAELLMELPPRARRIVFLQLGNR
jgi:DNA-directed RNA polymerase specialized sigma24 family protein